MLDKIELILLLIFIAELAILVISVQKVIVQTVVQNRKEVKNGTAKDYVCVFWNNNYIIHLIIATIITAIALIVSP